MPNPDYPSEEDQLKRGAEHAAVRAANAAEEQARSAAEAANAARAAAEASRSAARWTFWMAVVMVIAIVVDALLRLNGR